MNKEPLVTILIPVYNGSNYVADAIESALAQTYKNLEILVVNDGSCDDDATEKVVLSYGEKVRYLKKKNGGVSSALNLGIKNMRGDYMSWLSHDDVYLPDKIEKQIRKVTGNNDIILCSGSLMDADRNPIVYRIKKLNGKYNGVELFREFLQGYILNGLGFFIPKSVFEKCGLFDESMRYLQDLDLWMRMMIQDYNFICMPDQLVISRIHGKQVTNTAKPLFYKDQVAIAKKHIELLKCISKDRQASFCELYYCLFAKDNNTEGINLIKCFMRDNGITVKNLFMKLIPYYVKGALIRIRRKVIQSLFSKIER